jgi:hypothetical protein
VLGFDELKGTFQAEGRTFHIGPRCQQQANNIEGKERLVLDN